MGIIALGIGIKAITPTKFGTTKMEFFSVKEFSEKVKGARRDILFINEANNIPLSLSTS